MGVICDEIIELEGPLQTWASSKIGQRAFCGTCGSSVWHRFNNSEQWTFGQGLFDDQSDWKLSHELFADARPDHFAFADEGQKAFTGWGTLWAFLLGRLPK